MKNQSELHSKRVWEIDALRGFLMFCILVHHIYFMFEAACINSPFSNFDAGAFLLKFDPKGILLSVDENGSIQKSWYNSFYQIVSKPGVDLFFVLSGISYRFSRNSLKNAMRLLCGAMFISVFTKLLALCTGDEKQFIRFGALHCYAACHLIYYFLLEKRNDKILMFVALGSLALGYYLRSQTIYTNVALLVPLGFYEYGVHTRDFWPVFPMLGWFLIGIIVGRHWYPIKETRFPSQAARKWHKPLCFLGRHSGLIYCGHMVVYAAVFCAIGHIFNLY